MTREPTDREAPAISRPRALIIASPDAAAMAPYGWLLGNPFPGLENQAAFRNPRTAFWREHLFDPGDDGQTEVLWVEYTNDDPLIKQLEKHHRTEQAVVPLTAEIVQIVALSTEDGKPDVSSIRAYRLCPGVGFCMRPGVWHATRTPAATCLMLTRRSTTIDLVKHLKLDAHAAETSLCEIQPIQVTRDSAAP